MKWLEAPEDEVLQEDLENLTRRFSDAGALRDAHILITGATGLVGSMLTRALCCINRHAGCGLRVFAQVRSPEKARATFGDLLDRGEITLVQGDVTRPIELEERVDYLFHTASVTASKTFVTQPVETLVTAIEGTRNMLELARRKQVKSMVYVSSMEAYGITDPRLDRVTEGDLGYIDVLSVRSSYSEGKRTCECLSSAYAAEYGVPVKIARLAQTFGAGVSVQDGRVFAQFTKSCMAGSDLVLHTEGKSMGNYCYTADAVAGLLTILLHGENAQAYTVVNESTSMPIREVARLVSDTLTGGKSKVVFDIPESALTFGYAPDVTMRLSGAKLRALGWEPTVDLQEMFRRLERSFRAQQAEA